MFFRTFRFCILFASGCQAETRKHLAGHCVRSIIGMHGSVLKDRYSLSRGIFTIKKYFEKCVFSWTNLFLVCGRSYAGAMNSPSIIGLGVGPLI